MNFDDAIAAHTKWKSRLRACIDGHEKLNPADVSKDNMCDLGKWIYGEGAKHSSIPAFSTLKSEHANFHKVAGEIAKKASAGDTKGALADLESPAYQQTSTKTVTAIMSCGKAVGG